MIAFTNIFQEIAALLIFASAVSVLLLWLRQPLIVAYILVGVLAGPSVFGIIASYDEVDLLAQMGIAVLLFAVGLKLDLHLMNMVFRHFCVISHGHGNCSCSFRFPGRYSLPS